VPARARLAPAEKREENFVRGDWLGTGQNGLLVPKWEGPGTRGVIDLLPILREPGDLVTPSKTSTSTPATLTWPSLARLPKADVTTRR
jgi:hypothetical protein